MYRSSIVALFLLAVISFATISTGSPLGTVVRHDNVNATQDGHTPKPAEKPGAEHEGHTNDGGNTAEKPEETGDDHSSHGHGSHSAEKPAEEKPAGEKPAGEKPVGEKPVGDKPSHGHSSHGPGGGEKPAASPEPAHSASAEGPPVETIEPEEAEEAEPSPTAESGVCIAASMLRDFASDELVFKKHVLARVLCDAAGSCATRGHIVNFKGQGMMMGSYCDVVGCKEAIMEVNSPKYSRGLKIVSKSDDMHFTAFAARFETRGEEAVLSAAVRAGL